MTKPRPFDHGGGEPDSGRDPSIAELAGERDRADLVTSRRAETASHPKLAAGLLMAGVVVFLILISLAPLL